MIEFDFDFNDKEGQISITEDEYNGRAMVRIRWNGKRFNRSCLNMGLPDYDLDFRKRLFRFFGAPLDTYEFYGAHELRALFQFITNKAAGVGTDDWDEYMEWWDTHIDDRDDVEPKFLEDR